MNESKISVRYAKALFELAKDQNKLDTVKNDVELLLEMTKIDDFNNFLKSPVITISQKQDIFKNLLEGKVDKIVLDTLLLMAQNRREAYLKITALNFLKLYRNELNITEVELTTAIELDENSKKAIIDMLKEKVGEKIDLKTNVNPDIIGGFIVRIEDKQLDASVSGQLQKFKKELTK